MNTTALCDGFRQAMERAGLVPPAVIPLGNLIRFPGVGKSTGNKSGWAWLSEDGQGGAYGDWASDLSETWHAQHDTKMTAAERAAHRQRVEELRCIRQEEEARQHAEAAQRAQQLWDGAKPAPANHPYLIQKGIQPYGLRVDDENRLIVPVMIGGSLGSLQFIAPDGDKQFLPGGKVKGGFFPIGDIRESVTIVTCEGFATGASLHDATEHPVIVAFHAGNLLPVAKALRDEHPTARIVLAADNDLHADGKDNTGVLAATAAAKAIGGIVAIPEAINNHKTDWNDVHVTHGIAYMRRLFPH